jgi:hypothetical protein
MSRSSGQGAERNNAHTSQGFETIPVNENLNLLSSSNGLDEAITEVKQEVKEEEEEHVKMKTQLIFFFS